VLKIKILREVKAMRSITKLLLLIAALAASQTAYAEGALEIPQPNSSQSGISVVSGWHCDADLVEVSFDGGQRIPVAYGTTRNDTQGPCGDTNNGFSLLWAYGLLGTGNHTVVAYADGVEFGRATFWVTDIANMDFLRGKTSAKRVYGFPELNYDLILRWQEANQNFVIDDILPSIDSYDVTGFWEVQDGGQYVSEILLVTSPTVEDPRVGIVFVLEANPQIGYYRAVGYGGAITGNRAILMTGPETGADVTAEMEVVFSGPRSAILTLTECSPIYDCPYPIGYTLRLVKLFPTLEDSVLPNSLPEDESSISEILGQFADDAAEKLLLQQDSLSDTKIIPRIR